jgi:hypothetical protein
MISKLGMLSMMGGAAIFGEMNRPLYYKNTLCASSIGVDIRSIDKARKLSRRGKAVIRSRKKK